jgi:hypothetical protein
MSNRITIVSPNADYVVGELLGETEVFTLYSCTLPEGSPGILKITKTIAGNGALDKEAFILQTLRDFAIRIEEESERQEPGKGNLGYRKFFPILVESFVSADQGNRRINILSLSEVCEKLPDLVPLEQLVSREHVRVDPKTSVWIMGKLLKLLDFAHMQGISVTINGENILINRDQHFVMIFDWSNSFIHDGEVPDHETQREIFLSAIEVILALGGNLETGELPADEQLKDDLYAKLLFAFVSGEEKNAAHAHSRFYGYVRSIWPSEFYPFTAYALK